jgi:helicase conserved C-domain protein
MGQSQSFMMGITAGYITPYAQEPVNGTWVADVMPKVFDKQKSLNLAFNSMNGIPPVPILIKAPTGTGKTYFIEKVLTEIAKQNRGCVLMFVNRTALVRQILNDSCKLSLGYSYSSDSMNGINQINNLIVLTYQQFAGDLNTALNNLMLPQNIQYVVMDEAHFFTADASFNYQTPNILENILRYSLYRQRIYMSATPEDVKSIIAYEEYIAWRICLNNYLSSHNCPVNLQYVTPENINLLDNPLIDSFCTSCPPTIFEYSIPPRPYKANVKFFSSWETIIEAITSQNSNEQWLIFVANKDDGTFLHSEIKDISAFVTAEEKGQIIEQIEQTAKYTQRVLITTSVLDNGVSLKNDNLHNVVIDSADYVGFMQMLGRKRVKDDEPINIYVRNKTSSDFESYCKSIEVRITAINSFEKDPYAFIEEQYDLYPLEIRKMFAYDRRYNMRFSNKYLLHCLGQKHSKYIDMISALAQDKNAFAKEVCSWIGVDFNEEMLMSDDIFANKWEKIEPIILSHDERFSEDELTNIFNLFCKILKPNSRNTKMTFDGSKIKNSINTNLKIMADNGCPHYCIRNRYEEYYFERKGKHEEESDESFDE